MARAVYEWFRTDAHQSVLLNLKRYLTIQSELVSHGALPLSGRVYVLTGTLSSVSRDEAKTKLRSLGATITESVSTQTTAVIAGEHPGSKCDKARTLGVPVLTEKDFVRIVGA